MRYVGIDIASEKHFVAVVDEAAEVLVKSTAFGENASGYERLFELLGEGRDTLVALEATGHYWKNLYAALAAHGFAVALLNPLRTRRFAEEDLQRTKTDAIDALGIARFAAQKRPPVSRMPDSATDELRELVRHRDRLMQEFGVRKNPWLRQYYGRLRANGKPPKVALIASMRKLLHAAYAVARDRRPFSPKLAGAPA